MISVPDTMAYKVLTGDEWMSLAADEFRGAPIDLADGFIHLSTAAQLAETLERHFAGQIGLILAAIDLSALGDSVRWEPSRNGQLFPHVYGVLKRAHVVACHALGPTPGGALDIHSIRWSEVPWAT